MADLERIMGRIASASGVFALGPIDNTNSDL